MSSGVGTVCSVTSTVCYFNYQQNALHCGVSLSKQWWLSLITAPEYGMKRSTSKSCREHCSIQTELPTTTLGLLSGCGYSRQPQQLYKQHALLYLLSWDYSVCVLFALLFQQCGMLRHIRFYVSFSPLLFAGSLWVTLRTQWCHTNDI